VRPAWGRAEGGCLWEGRRLGQLRGAVLKRNAAVSVVGKPKGGMGMHKMPRATVPTGKLKPIYRGLWGDEVDGTSKEEIPSMRGIPGEKRQRGRQPREGPQEKSKSKCARNQKKKTSGKKTKAVIDEAGKRWGGRNRGQSK